MQLHAQTNVPTELILPPVRQCAPHAGVEVDVVFAGPDDQCYRVPAFLGSDGQFHVRFAGPMPGRYDFHSICSDPGLDGHSGSVEVVPYEGDNPLFRHGRLSVSPTRRTLQHADGAPFFWLGDTWWMGLTKRLDWPDGFRELAADRVAKGFSLIQIVAGPLPDFDASDAVWHTQQANEAGWPWECDWAGINPRFYDLADLRIAALVGMGLVPCIVGMWGYYIIAMGVERAQAHWRNLIARYAAYPVVWCSAGEVNMPTYSHHADAAVRDAEARAQTEGWTAVTRSIRETDPFHNPITAHPSSPDSRAMLTDESVLDVDMLQTGHGGYAVLQPSVERVREAVALEPRMPVVNGEPCYEGIMGGGWQEVQRFLFWTSMTCGAAGHTYGAQGIWAMSSRHEPFVGSTSSWGDHHWQDAMHFAGSAQMGVGRRIVERYRWWLFQPREEPALPPESMCAFATGIPGEVALYYLPANCIGPPLRGIQGGGWAYGGLRIPVTIEPGVRYKAFYVNPRTGAEHPIPEPVIADSNGRWGAPPKPTMEDWVLALESEGARVAAPSAAATERREQQEVASPGRATV